MKFELTESKHVDKKYPYLGMGRISDGGGIAPDQTLYYILSKDWGIRIGDTSAQRLDEGLIIPLKKGDKLSVCE